MEDCNEQTDKPYVLPSWRVNQSIMIAVRFLNGAGYYKDGFDYKRFILGKGIALKGYSSFKPENLKELRKVSLSLWDEGLCLVFHDRENSEKCCMIAYNDKKSVAEIMQIIFHEFGHIELRHTEQSPNAEAEATLFSAIATFLVIAEQRFHIGRLIASERGAESFFNGMRAGFMEKQDMKEAV